MDKEIVISALNKAMLRQGNPKNVIIHSDRGSQYLSSKYIKLVESYSCQRSYSAKGNPFDNAVIESFHAILKKKKFIVATISRSKKLIWPYFNILRVGIILEEFIVALII